MTSLFLRALGPGLLLATALTPARDSGRRPEGRPRGDRDLGRPALPPRPASTSICVRTSPTRSPTPTASPAPSSRASPSPGS